ncbi:MAG: hypothetical protein LBM02_08180 [Lachnospiraceae bacterium]|jgi:tRNA threonylcarbamoyladenosine modification (KEOPS) complex  Pcc1 subunit|nr:hypothetical protein [Lachnospiraceae bacterium]
MLVTRKDIGNNKNFVLKWNDNPQPGGAENPVWGKVQTADNFIIEATKATTFMDASQVIDMIEDQMELKYFGLKMDLQYQRAAEFAGTVTPEKPESSSISAQDEARLKFDNKVLKAQPFIGYVDTPKNFIEENIEKEGFLNTMESKLGANAGVSLESIGVYGTEGAITNAELTKKATGYGAFDGFLKQLTDVQNDDSDNVGVSEHVIDPNGADVIKTLKIGILQYLRQGGNKADAVIACSPTIEFVARNEISNRQTALGDAMVTSDDRVVIAGFPLESHNVFAEARNGWDEHILIGNVNNNAYGIRREVTAEQEYSAKKQEYTSVVTCKGDVKLYEDRDTLAMKVEALDMGALVSPTESESE